MKNLKLLSMIVFLLPSIAFSDYYTSVGYSTYGPYDTVAKAEAALKSNAEYGEHLTQKLPQRTDPSGNEVYTYGFEDQPPTTHAWNYKTKITLNVFPTEQESIDDYKNVLLSNPRYCTVGSITRVTEYSSGSRGVCPFGTSNWRYRTETQSSTLKINSTYDATSTISGVCQTNNYRSSQCRYRYHTCRNYLLLINDLCTNGKTYNIWGTPTSSHFINKNDLVELIKDTNLNSCSLSIYTPNPINTTDGNKTRQENDFNSSGLSPLKFTRYYNSQKNQSSTLGTNWSHSYTTSLTANIHEQAVPYVSGDSNFSSLSSTAQLACESGWDDIKATYNKPELTSSTATYLNNSCAISDANGNALGSIPVRDNSTGGASPNPPQDTVVIERANGNTIVFTLVNSVWTAPSDTDVSLVQTASGYTLTTAQDTIEEYNPSGQLVSTTDRQGMQQVLSYNTTTGLLESVTDSLGKSLTFAYIGTNLDKVTLPDLTTLSYTYDAANNLETVVREDTSVKQYVYDDARFPNALTGIIDENLERYMTFTYDAQGRATTSELANGVEKVTVNFIDDATSTVTDALDKVRTYRFAMVNGEKKLTDIEGGACTSCGGSSTHTTYDANGYVNGSTDFNGNLTSYINNARGLALSRTEAVGTKDERLTTYEWHSTFSLPTCIIEATKTTRFVYNADGTLATRAIIDTSDAALFATSASKVCATIDARGDYASLNKRSISYTYYPNYGLVKTIDGARTDVNDITSFTYDAAGNLATITNALSQVTELKNYTLRGKPQTLIDANGLTTSITYDVRGRVDLVTVGSQVTNYDFDAVGNLDKVTRPDGSFIDYGYDAAHRLTDIRDQVGSHIHYTLDALGNRKGTDIKDAGGNLKRTSTAIYNQLGQLSKTIGAATQTTDYLLYDNNGNLKHVRDAESKNTWFGYDALNRLETTTNELTNTSTTTYDAQNNITSVTDLRGLVTNYKYDGLGNRTELNSPDTGITQYTSHDGSGNVLTMVDAKNQTTTYQYDAINRIDLVTYDDGTQTDYIYDQGVNAKSRLSSILYTNVSSSGSTAWIYDVYGRITSKTELVNTLALTTTYIYQPTTDLLKSMQTTGGHVVSYAYLNAQLNSILVDGNVLLKDITFDPFSIVKGWTWGNGLSSSRVYDQDGQLDTYTLGSRVFDVNYTLSGNVQNITDLATPSTQQVFNYDALHRIKNYNSSMGNEAYNYDANSNRLDLTDVSTAQTSTYKTDSISNRLLSISGLMNVSYVYDANGNITNDGIHLFNYDVRNRLVDVDAGGIKYQLNALGQRVQKSLAPIGSINGDDVFDRSDINALRTYIRNGGVYTASYDCNKDGVLDRNDLKCLRALVQYQRKNPDAPIDNGITLYVYNEQGQLVAEHTDTGIVKQEVLYLGNLPIAVLESNQVYYIHTDHLGTPRMITDTTNTPIWTWESDPFGTTAANDDPDGDGVNFVFNHRFAGQYYDWETGLHYNYFRDYDPTTGRYVQSDPIGLDGGLNTYGYVGGNPLSYVDPKGLFLPGWHNLFSYLGGIQAGMTKKQAAELAKQVVNVDSGKFWPGSQEVYNSHMHAMCADGLPLTICQKNFENWKKYQLNKCSIKGLAAALHAQQDFYSRSHMNFKRYKGMKDLQLNHPDHAIADMYPTTGEIFGISNVSGNMIKAWQEKCKCKK